MHRLLLAIPATIVLFCSLCWGTTPSYTISRTTLPFGTVAVGLSTTEGLAITSTGTASVTIQSVSVDNPNFQFAAGAFPEVLSHNGANFSYQFNFVPTAAQNYTGTATFMIDGAPAVVTLTGTGITTTAVATPNVTGLSFTEPQGVMSKALKVKITNTGTSTLNILSVSTQAPFSTPSIKEVNLPAGASTNLSVSYFGGLVGTTTGNLLITYDVVHPTGISLKGTTTAATSLAITNYPALPLGTAGFAYLAQLNSAAGTGAVAWSLASGSLPPGLTLSIYWYDKWRH